MTQNTIDQWKATLADWQAFLDQLAPDRSCHTCGHLETRLGGAKFCGNWGSEVPAEALDDGCTSWIDHNCVPF